VAAGIACSAVLIGPIMMKSSLSTSFAISAALAPVLAWGFVLSFLSEATAFAMANPVATFVRVLISCAVLRDVAMSFIS